MKNKSIYIINQIKREIKMKKVTVIFVAIALMISTNLFAQRTTDIEGAKDYPLVSRFEGAIIQFYKATKWDTYKLPVYSDNIKQLNYENPLVLEGKVERWQYTTTPDNNPAYVMKNFEMAFKKSDYKILAEGKPGDDIGEGSGGFNDDFYGDMRLDKFGFGFDALGNHKAIIIAKTNKDGKDIYIVEVISDFSNVTVITQDVIEVEEAETGMVTAKSMADNIAATGHIAIYDIHFDTSKSDIKPESADALKNIAEYLNAHSDKKYIIVGHTDNTGDFEANLKLSKARADAVMNELVTKYSVKAEQLKAYGDGQTAPIANNSTKEGKAKNRRVEIVVQ